MMRTSVSALPLITPDAPASLPGLVQAKGISMRLLTRQGIPLPSVAAV